MGSILEMGRCREPDIIGRLIVAQCGPLMCKEGISHEAGEEWAAGGLGTAGAEGILCVSGGHDSFSDQDRDYHSDYGDLGGSYD